MEFDDEYDAKDAVRDLDGKEICGQKVRIELSNVSFFKTYIYNKLLSKSYNQKIRICKSTQMLLNLSLSSYEYSTIFQNLSLLP